MENEMIIDTTDKNKNNIQASQLSEEDYVDVD